MRELLARAQEGDKEARDQLVSDNVGLVWSVVRRFGNRGHDMEDLFQIGCIGLIKCIDKFDLSYDVKFSTYAVPMITGEIKRFLRDDGMIKVSRSLKENAYKAKAAREQFCHQHGREPTIIELADILDIDKEDLIVALESNIEVDSLSKTIYQSDGNSISLMDKLEEQRDDNKALIDKITIGDLMKHLDEKEREIIRLRYFEEKTQTEIAKLMGVSQVQVSRLEKKILLNMRNRLVS